MTYQYIRPFFGTNRLMKIFQRIAIGLLAATGIAAILWPVAVSKMQMFGTLPNEAEICALYRANGFCSAEWYDDGAARVTVSSTPMQNCCEIERYNLDDNQINFKFFACETIHKTKVSCMNFEGSENFQTFNIDGKILRRVTSDDKSD